MTTTKPEKPSVEFIRTCFEEMVKTTVQFKDNTPLGAMTINDKFHHYMEPDTDTLWIGFATGMRWAWKLQKESVDAAAGV